MNVVAEVSTQESAAFQLELVVAQTCLCALPLGILHLVRDTACMGQQERRRKLRTNSGDRLTWS